MHREIKSDGASMETVSIGLVGDGAVLCIGGILGEYQDNFRREEDGFFPTGAFLVFKLLQRPESFLILMQ